MEAKRLCKWRHHLQNFVQKLLLLQKRGLKDGHPHPPAVAVTWGKIRLYNLLLTCCDILAQLKHAVSPRLDPQLLSICSDVMMVSNACLLVAYHIIKSRHKKTGLTEVFLSTGIVSYVLSLCFSSYHLQAG